MSMKRYLLLFLSTALILGCFIAAGIIFKPESVSVKTWTLEPTCASDQLMCTGTVKRENEKEIVLSQNILVTEVFVKKGDTVTAGQKLFSYQIASENSSAASQQTYAELWEEYQKTGQIPDEVETLLAGVESQPQTSHEQEGETKTASSPIDGTVMELGIQEGTFLSAGETAVTVAEPQNLKIELQINEANVSRIQVGQTAKVTGSGFPEEQYSAEVVSISDAAVTQTSTSGKEAVVEVILKVLDANEKIKPGYTVKASVVTETVEDAIQIPYDAVLADEEGNEYIYVVSQHRAVIQPITAVKEYTSGIVIEESLEEGTSIILEPERVKQGDYVKCFETEAFAND